MASVLPFCGLRHSIWNRITNKPSHVFARQINTTNVLTFRTTPCVLGEPLRKKKRIDPAVLKARDERRKRKISKEIRRLEKNVGQLKPIEERSIPYEYFKNKELYQRHITVSPEVQEQRVLLLKEYSTFKSKISNQDQNILTRLLLSQKIALDNLKAESEDLYKAAVEIDNNLLPFTFNGPAETPKIKNYKYPDGEYIDVSRDWLKKVKIVNERKCMIQLMEAAESGDDLGTAFLADATYMVHGDDLEDDVDGNLSAENTDDDVIDSGEKIGTPLREQDRFLPIANVAKIMKKAVPELGKIAKDARECVQECVSEFISFITSEASDRCHMEKRKTINGEDILFAMTTLGFDNYVEPLKIYLQKYREATKGDKTHLEEVYENKVFSTGVLPDTPSAETVIYAYPEQMQQFQLP